LKYRTSGAAAGESLAGRRSQPLSGAGGQQAAGLQGMDQQLQPGAPVAGEFEVSDELALRCTMQAAIERLKFLRSAARRPCG